MKIPALKNNKILISIIAATMLTMNAYANDKTSLVIAAVAMQKDNQLQIVLRERVEHIASKLKSEGIESIDVYLSDNVPDMVEAIKKGEVDWVSDSLFMSLILSEETQSEIFIRKDKDVKKHETIFFVSKTSKSTSINGLEKKIVLFPDSISSSGFFVPFYELSNFGYTPRVYGQGDGKENNKKKRIFYRFQSNTIKIVDDVLRNNLNIGVMIDRDYNSLSDDVKKKLRIIHQTAAYPETVELIRSDLNLKIKQKLKKLLLGDYDAKSTDSVAVSKSEGRRFEKFVAEGQDGYIYLRNIIQHEVVPINFDIKK